MSETIKWSFSADRCFRQCQRQYFLSQVAAYHSAKDPIRREAFLCKQVKTLEAFSVTSGFDWQRCTHRVGVSRLAYSRRVKARPATLEFRSVEEFLSPATQSSPRQSFHRHLSWLCSALECSVGETLYLVELDAQVS